MNNKLLRNREHCLDHAQGFIDAARRVGASDFPHIVYHLSILALEEVGKSNMIAGQLATGETMENGWIDKALESHRRKLQWAIWSPIDRIDPKDFEAARDFAERAHEMRLSSLYVDAKAELTDIPASEVVTKVDAEQLLELAQARLDFERASGTPDPEASSTDEVLCWFLDKMADPIQSRQLLSKPFIEHYHAVGNDARAWIIWAREEFDRREQEAVALLQAELAKPGAAIENAKPKWRANATVFTPSHSLRPKVLKSWNEKIDAVQLLWTGKKDQLTMQITLLDNTPLSALSGRAISLAKLVVACLNIGSIGYFWFKRPGFEQVIFDQVLDIENGSRLQIEARDSFWGDNRAAALSDEQIGHAITCMMAFAPLSEADAEPIFRPYFDGLALIAKSDVFYSVDDLARRAFVGCLAGAFFHYEGWDGKEESFRACFDAAFTPIMPAQEHRDQMFPALTPEGDPNETSLVNLRSAKQLADLYLILVGKRTWRTILDSHTGD
jgi:AbiV family abortive infection protein